MIKNIKWLWGDKCIFWGIYLIAIGLTFTSSIFKMELVADSLTEYEYYLSIIESGKWSYEVNNLITSCVISTYIPAIVQRITHLEPQLVFRIFPCIFYSMMPAFSYLISRRYLNKRYSLLAVGFILSSFYFLYAPLICRIGIALGLWAGMLWAMLGKRIILASVFAFMVVIAHYGTAYYAILAIGGMFVYMLALHRKQELKTIGIVLAVLVVITAGWHFGISWESGRYGRGFIKQAIEMTAPESYVIAQYPDATRSEVSELKRAPEMKKSALFSLGSRESVVQAAFGAYWPVMNIPQKIEWGLSWLLVALLSVGVFAVWRFRLLSDSHRGLVALAYIAILLAVIVPTISVYYGVVRLYFTGLPILVPCIVIGGKYLCSKVNIKAYYPLAAFILMYVLCVSGTVHLMFGLVK